ncbi:chemotaxis protein CheA [Catenovulum adriaticum]|uniref:Chemotaxis protein CheA n=1 Tax=Catenovulum adriaticum TaxID=2984846 RepID=A0ABY7ANA7_9ALTE|nr:chemotaxis protein CheA [Catenovulum sp. TS8]WAJ69940.1 chemotaxis protein CheA [Catenovulum sp. TS8]
MSIDLSQFFEVFFEESFEGLDIMESELLELQPGEPDNETINTIFRAAHSIKGGSGTFGFNSVADFTHVVETLLDQIRDGQRQLTQQYIDLLLQSVDCLRDILSALRAEEEPDTEQAQLLKAEFNLILAADASQIIDATPSEPNLGGNLSIGWVISFKPGLDILKTGNEPLYLLQELAELGELTVNIDISDVPALTDIEPEDCYFKWTLTLVSDCSKAQISEIFEWIEDECEINIHGLSQSTNVENDNSFSGQEIPVSKSAIESSMRASNASAQQLNNFEPVASDAEINIQHEIKAPTSNQKKSAKQTESGSIRVGIEKVDSLINMVGELVITQAMLTQLSEGELDNNKLLSLQAGLAQLAHNTRDLQESVMRIRMLPIGSIFSRFPRLVRDTSKKLDKKIELKLTGEQTELDKTLMEKISDPLVHLVRNAMDHGLESPAERLAAGKNETGQITLNAYHQGGNIVIEIVDDGRGLNTKRIREKAISNGLIAETDDLTDDQINLLIFEPGFSTAEQVSDLSGRGVGMDVVRRNIQALNGSVELASKPAEGSTVIIRLPLTLAILDGQLLSVGSHIYIIPLINIIESLQVKTNAISRVGGELDVLKLRDEYIPIIRLSDVFSHQGSSDNLEDGLLVVVENDNEKVGLFVDELLSQQQVVIKSLEANYFKVDGISGATILGDGTVSLILDIAGIVKLAGLNKSNTVFANQTGSLESATV